MSIQILVATTNPGKIEELNQLLDLDAQFLGLKDVGPFPEVVEDGKTFVENARKKATEYARASGLWTISDDSGLVVDALDGAPGVYSARYCGDHTSVRSVVDKKNIEKVLEQMQDVDQDERTARFMCCICLANPERVLIETSGSVEGIIAVAGAGDGGFGYDPIFFLPSLGKTVAQLDAADKNEVSHRGNAIRTFKPLLSSLISDTVKGH
jgi:XTP/dITP diphosphohydrolase